ncbi:MAG: type IV pilus modification protein PilV [Gammaproteobacteria bacterium]
MNAYPAKGLTPSIHRQQGFSLLEVLLAMLIVGIAVLAFAAMQVRALDTTGGSHLRAQAAVLAADFAERARMLVYANEHPLCLAPPDETLVDFRACVRAELMETWATGEQPPAGAPSDWNEGEETCIFPGAFNGGVDRCDTPEILARADMLEARFLARQLLPQGTMDLRACDAGSDLSCIFVGWRGVDATDADACEPGGVNPDCLVMQVLL